MDTRDGRILDRLRDSDSAQVGGALLAGSDWPYVRDMGYTPTPIQRLRGKVGRNDACPCGSGKKFKKCCLGRKVSR